MQKIFIYIALFLTLNSFSEAWAGSFDIGLGLGFTDSRSSESFDDGWDVQIGYEMIETDNWNFGTQFHLIKSWTSESDVEEARQYAYDDDTIMAFDSQALYLTARPENWWVHFKAGIVNADYHTIKKDVNSRGIAMGVGITLGSEDIRLHLFDFHRYKIGGDSFNIYTISAAFLIGYH